MSFHLKGTHEVVTKGGGLTIQVNVGLPDVTSENWAESPLYGELYPITKPAYNLSQAVQYMQYISNISNMHTNYDPTIYPIVTRVNIYTLKQYIY